MILGCLVLMITSVQYMYCQSELCSSNPCFNNATCIETGDEYMCVCHVEYTGSNCQVFLNACSPDTCFNGGTCIDVIDGHVCQCPIPYKGDNCSKLPCDSLPCQNQAECFNDVTFNQSETGYICRCLSGFTGMNCEENIGECVSAVDPCSGHGLCVDGVDEYRCLCEPGWVGQQCQHPVDDCIGNSCKNNATCTDFHLGYLCTCADGYEGWLCEREIDECTKWQPCKNSATCVDMFNDYRCECSPGWVGRNCSEEINECEVNPCVNDAKCVDVVDGFICQCRPFYTGTLCETVYNPCAPEYNPCQNGATCITPPDGQYICFCDTGFSGVNCELNINECLDLPCLNNGTCEDVISGYKCHCSMGWTGSNCEENIDDCVDHLCQNGGECVDELNRYSCNCSSAYQGQFCEIAVDFCDVDTCLNNATCISLVGEFECLCPHPFTGRHCEVLMDKCQNDTCVNNGTCINTRQGFQCLCPSPYTGITCTDNIDFCDSEPCFNEATCISLSDDYFCVCPEFLGGKQCTELADYCKDDPCENDGLCINGQYQFLCICAFGFEGTMCANMTNFCAENPCQNEANCTNVPGGFRCDCHFNFTGELCQDEILVVPPEPSSSNSAVSSRPLSELSGVLSTSNHFPVSSSSAPSSGSLSSSVSSFSHHSESSQTLSISSSFLASSGGSSFSRFSTPLSIVISGFVTSSTIVPASSSYVSYSSTKRLFSAVETPIISTIHSSTTSSIIDIDFSSKSITISSPSSQSSKSTDLPRSTVSVGISNSAIIVPSILSTSGMPTFSTLLTSTNLVSTTLLKTFNSDFSVLESTSESLSDPSMSLIGSEISSLSSSKQLDLYSSDVFSPTKDIQSQTSEQTEMATSLLDTDKASTTLKVLEPSISKIEVFPSTSSTFLPPSTILPSFDSSIPDIESTASLTSFSTTSTSSLEFSELSLLFSSYQSDINTPTSRSDTSTVLDVTLSSAEYQNDSSITSIDSSSEETDYQQSSITPSSLIITRYRSTSFTDASSLLELSLSLMLHSSPLSTSISSISLSSAETKAILPTSSLPSTTSFSSSPTSFLSSSSSVSSSPTTSVTTTLSSRSSSSIISLSSSETTGTNVIDSTAVFSNQKSYETPVPTDLSSTSFSITSHLQSKIPTIDSTTADVSITLQTRAFSSSGLESSSRREFPSSSLSTSYTTVYQLSQAISTISAILESTFDSIIQTQIFSSTLATRLSSKPLVSFDSTIQALSSLTIHATLPSTVFQETTNTRFSWKFTSTRTKSVLTTASVVMSGVISDGTHLSSIETTYHSSMSSQPSLESRLQVSSDILFTLTPIIAVDKTSSDSIFSTTARAQLSPTSSEMSTLLSPVMLSSPTTSMTSISLVTTPVLSTIDSTSSTTPTTPSCGSVACLNSGQCREDQLGVYCDCSDGFIGTKCETESTVCDGHNCENGGKCVVTLGLFDVQMPTCECPIPFTGPRCEDETLLYFPSFTGGSFIWVRAPILISGNQNEIALSIKTKQDRSTVLYSSTHGFPDDMSDGGGTQNDGPFIRLYIEAGVFHYTFSCGWPTAVTIQTDVIINTGDVYEIVIRQSWPSRVGQWCSASIEVNGRTYVSDPALTTVLLSQMENIFLGGYPRLTYQGTRKIHPLDGYIGCARNLQINGEEIDITTAAFESKNIGNCNVPVCQHSPCRNGGTCHSNGAEWYCKCPFGYGGPLCAHALCDVNTCNYGGTCVILEDVNDQLCICPYGTSGPLCEQELNIEVPRFYGSKYGYASYMAYEAPHFLEKQFEFYIEFTMDNGSSDSSMLLFLGNTGYPDFMVLGVERGYTVFRFDLGSGFCQIYSTDPIDLTLPFHTVSFGRDVKNGWLQLDNQRNMTSRSSGALTSLNTNTRLYVGGIDEDISKNLPDGAKFEDGFKGCVLKLEVRTSDLDFTVPGNPPGHVVDGRNVDECDSQSCDQNPCAFNSLCEDVGASIFCSCDAEHTGILCFDEVSACDSAHACSDGSTCVPTMPDGYMCQCPLGREGEHCKDEISISDAWFNGADSYLTFQPVHVKRESHITVQLRPEKETGLIFYVSQYHHTIAGDFLALVLEEGVPELRFNLGSGLVRVASEIVVKMGSWSTITSGRNETHGYIDVNGQSTVTMVTGMMSYLDVVSDFYVGGLAYMEDIAKSVFQKTPEYFRGCIRELVVNGEDYKLTETGAMQGRNIVDCDGSNCGFKTCSNGGSCHVNNDTSYNCTCAVGYYGDTCKLPIQCKDNGCVRGACSAKPDVDYVCNCEMGWAADYCEEDVTLDSSIQFTDNSFLVLSDVRPEPFNKSISIWSFNFKTSATYGMIVWSGKNHADDDYMGIGISGGRLKLVWNLGWMSRGEIETTLRYNDDNWHSVKVVRLSQTLTMTADGVTYEDRVSGDFYDLDTDNQIYLGGFESASVKEKTFDYFRDNFQGCLSNLSVDLQPYFVFDGVVTGQNIQPCS